MPNLLSFREILEMSSEDKTDSSCLVARAAPCALPAQPPVETKIEKKDEKSDTDSLVSNFIKLSVNSTTMTKKPVKVADPGNYIFTIFTSYKF